MIVKLAFTGAIFYFLIRGNQGRLIASLKDVEPGWLSLSFALFVVYLLASAWRWWALLKVQKIKVGFGETFSMYMQGLFFSLFLPGGSLGGDLVRAGFVMSRMPKGGRLEGMFTILVDRVIGMMGLFTLVIVSTLACLPFILHSGEKIQLIIFFLAGAALCGLIAGTSLYFHRTIEKIRIINFFLKIADRVSKGKLQRMMAALDLYHERYWTLCKCLFVSFVFVHLNYTLVAMCLARGLLVRGVAPKIYLLTVSMANTASIVPITPGGFGTRDFIINEILKNSGVPEGEALALPILLSGIILSCNLLGGLFFLFNKRRAWGCEGDD